MSTPLALRQTVHEMAVQGKGSATDGLNFSVTVKDLSWAAHSQLRHLRRNKHIYDGSRAGAACPRLRPQLELPARIRRV